MEIKELKSFCIVAKLGSFSKASQILAMGQSAVTKQVAGISYNKFLAKLASDHPQAERTVRHHSRDGTGVRQGDARRQIPWHRTRHRYLCSDQGLTSAIGPA